ncbi:hypothetical protein [Macrococcus equi]|uniref:hypothetical protein n=1 Tax=Macrococcus equi TaxID=3395462 RepID=UPI0039BDBC7B
MFSKRNLSRGELLFCGLLISGMVLLGNMSSGFKLDVGLIPLSVGLSYLIRAIEPGGEKDDERDKKILLESMNWTILGLFIVWSILYALTLFSAINLSKELYLIIPMAFFILAQSIIRVILSKFVM